MRDKQIEDMAKDICRREFEPNCETCYYKKSCRDLILSENLHDAGYRKSTDVAEEIFAEIEKAFIPTVLALFMTSETLVDVSKSHISEEKAIKDIRNYLNKNNVICSRYRLKETLAELKKKYGG